MRILHFEDNAEKYMAIQSVLKSMGIHDVVWEESVEAGLKQLENNTFDVVISDMHFPIHPNGPADWEAGAMVIEELQKRNIDISVIIISSMCLQIPQAYKCIWCVDSRDWETELRNCLKTLM